MPELAGHHHVALSVSDCAESAAWYARVLGFVELFAEEGETRRARVMGFPGGGMSVGLVEHGVERGAVFDPTRIGLDHAAFTVAERAELDAWAAHFEALGVTYSAVVDTPRGAILNFRDPDRCALALFWDAPAAG